MASKEGPRRSADARSEDRGKPSSQRRKRTDARVARRCDVLRNQLVRTLRSEGRYEVRQNVSIPLTSESIALIGRAKGAYLGCSLPAGSDAGAKVTLDVLIIDSQGRWAGGFAVSSSGSVSERARRRLGTEIRASELVMRSFLRNHGWPGIDTVVVGIIDYAASVENEDDIVLSTTEAEALLDVKL